MLLSLLTYNTSAIPMHSSALSDKQDWVQVGGPYKIHLGRVKVCYAGTSHGVELVWWSDSALQPGRLMKYTHTAQQPNDDQLLYTLPMLYWHLVSTTKHRQVQISSMCLTHRVLKKGSSARSSKDLIGKKIQVTITTVTRGTKSSGR